MTIIYHDNVEQGTPEWHALRCGVLTASEMKLIITPTYKVANNDKVKMHAMELLAQRITKYVEPTYVNDAMLRGHEDEITSRELYSEKYEPVEETGFITNDKWGFTIGYSPDGLVGKYGGIEIKSRCQKYQVQTIVDWCVPKEHDVQVQTALLVSERKWIDYIQYCSGMHMCVIRVYPDIEKQEAIIEAARKFEATIQEKFNDYISRLKTDGKQLTKTERTIEEEIIC